MNQLKNAAKHFDNMKRISEGEDIGLENYEYLDYCLECGNKIKFYEAYTHTFGGNYHKFGCSLFVRLIGSLYNILIKLILLPFLLIGVVIYPFIIFKRVLFGEKCGGW